MLLVRQTCLYDCGVAVAAMVTNTSYEMVLDRLVPGLSSETEMNQLVMWRTLQDITQSEWQVIPLRQPFRIGEFAFPESRAAVLIQRPCLTSWHYVAVEGQRIYDPLFDEPFSQADYPDGSSWVVTMFTRKAGERQTICSTTRGPQNGVVQCLTPPKMDFGR